MQSVLEYYWTKIFVNGSEIAQFDEFGNTHRWYDDDSKGLKAVVYKPFSPSLAAAVTTVSGIETLIAPHQPITIVVKPTDEVVAKWDNGLTTSNPYHCDSCGYTWMTEAAYEFPTCPQCGTRDEFWCESCLNYIDPDRVIRKPTGQLECPDCDHPQGLIPTYLLKQIVVNRHFVEYVCEVKDKFRFTIRETGEFHIETL